MYVCVYIYLNTEKVMYIFQTIVPTTCKYKYMYLKTKIKNVKTTVGEITNQRNCKIESVSLNEL